MLFSILGMSAFAQFTVWQDTVYYNGFPKDNIARHKADTVYNTSAVDTLSVTWSKVSDNFLTGWSGSSICDWNTCETYSSGFVTAKLNPGSKGVIYPDVKALSTAADGCSYVTIRLTQNGGSGMTKDLVYKYCSWPTSVKEVDPSNFVTIYPNPASNFINITINNDKITNLNILNVVGRKVAKFDVTPNTPNPIRIGLDNVADGVYLLQFTDASGKQLGVKRVTKN